MKTYLKNLTPEEIIKRLKNGEIIKSEEDDEIIIKYYDGVIYSSNKRFGDYQINVSFMNTGADEFYFDTEDSSLTFEEGKFYKTREGKKAYISRITKTRFYGIITGKTSLDTWNHKGMHWYDKSPHKNDLISKWED